MTTIAGSGEISYSGDGGAATAAALRYPYSINVDFSGNIYISDTYNSRVRKVAASTGIISTIAGTGASSYSGDGGAATSAALWYPDALELDPLGIQQTT